MGHYHSNPINNHPYSQIDKVQKQKDASHILLSPRCFGQKWFNLRTHCGDREMAVSKDACNQKCVEGGKLQREDIIANYFYQKSRKPLGSDDLRDIGDCPLSWFIPWLQKSHRWISTMHQQKNCLFFKVEHCENSLCMLFCIILQRQQKLTFFKTRNLKKIV